MRLQHRKRDAGADSVRVIVAKELEAQQAATVSPSVGRPAHISVDGGSNGSTGQSSPPLVAVVEKFDAAFSTVEVSAAKIKAGEGVVLVETGGAVEIRAPFLFDWGRFV